jgi:hypothetical protein
MKLANFIKSPLERKRYTIDYTDWLDTGETVQSIVFTVTPTTAATLQVDAYSIAVNGLSVVFFANYGNLGTVYTVEALMTTSGGQIKEDEILFTIRDP